MGRTVEDTFVQVYNQEMRRRAVELQKERSWGSVKECCRTCAHGTHNEEYQYVDCWTNGEVRVPSSYCLNWCERDKVRK